MVLERADFLVDSHCHLDAQDFDADRDLVIERARATGVRYVLTIASAERPESVKSSVTLAEQYGWIFVAAGVHPHEARHLTQSHLDELRNLARHGKLVAIGEIGLDYHYGHSPRDAQREALGQQLDLASELKLPVVIHCREAWADLRDIARGESPDSLRGILHCFTGSWEDASEFLDRGFLVSFAGNLTFKNADDLRALAWQVPLERLLTETDSPYLAPVPHRGKRNEPAYVRKVNQALATLRHLSTDEVGRQVVDNFVRFFHFG